MDITYREKHEPLTFQSVLSHGKYFGQE